jgi:DNA polymerase (family X)
MRANEAIVAIFEDIARMMDVLGEDGFRAIAHSKAARIVGTLTQDVGELAKDRAALIAINGIGPKLADKIIEFCTSGKVAEHEELRAKVPPGVLAMMEIPGLGPKTAHVLWKQGGVDSLKRLEAGIADGSLATLPRMGEKSVEKIRQNLALAKSAGDRLWLGRAQVVADVFLERLRACEHVERADVAGSLRRGRETIGDIDILVALKPGHESKGDAVSKVFCATPNIVQTIAAGESKSSVRVGLPRDFGRWKLEGKEGKEDPGPSIQVDLRVLPLSSWGSGLLYFTGSKEHNIHLRQLAIARGWTLSEWGLFDESGGKKSKFGTAAAAKADDRPPHERGLTPIAAATEEAVYEAMGLPWIPPEMREDRGELNLSTSPTLVEDSDIKAELHAHTTASDGSLSIVELATLAKQRGFHTIAVTDHSKSSLQANGLSVDRLFAHIDAVHAARSKIKGITILAGSEVDILSDGSLDYDDAVLAKLDVIVASPHAALSQDPEKATARLLKAIQHPRVHILGHPTGRLINKRKGLEPDMAKLFAAAARHRVALEINAHWMRLDLRDLHVRQAIEADCLIAIDCDVHEAEDYENLRFGVATARRGWCPKDRCVNTWAPKTLHEWLESKR